MFNFYEASLSGIKSNPHNASELLIDSLRFGLRVPIINPVIQNDGKNSLVFNYEQVGLTAKPLSVAFSEPTIIGTMTTSRQGELIVLVLTVKPDKAETARAAKANKF